MPEQIKTLVVDTVPASASQLYEVLKPDLVLSECEQVSSLFDAVRAISDSFFGICLICDAYKPEDLKAFFGDVLKLDRGKNCLFVQVRESLASQFDRSSLSAIGFRTVISRKGHADDRRSIIEAYKAMGHSVEVRKRVNDVDTTMGLLLDEVDRISEDRKRGRSSKFNTISPDFIADQTSFDTEVMESYYQKLTEVAETVAPQEYQGVEVPDAILKKNLPHLSKDNYSGVSTRVWAKLKKKFGVKRAKDEKDPS